MALRNMLTREIKYTRKTEKSAFREIFVARYVPILQYIISTISKTNLSIMETCIYLYVYLSISNIYLHVCLSVSISIYLSIYLCGRAHLDTHKLYIYIFTYVYIHVCMCVCMFLSMYVNMCVFTYR